MQKKHEPSEVPRISPEGLRERLRQGGNLRIIDVRSREAFAEGHIKGAISLPKEEFESWWKSLPQGEDLVFYCT
ncbi:MAG: rhodanese-like domain-containing protein [Nitrospinota bacterium]